MTNKVKPFYIRITDDMTPQIVQDAFDKCVDAGGNAFDGILGCDMKHSYNDVYEFCFVYFGVDFEHNTYLTDDQRNYGTDAQEITLDQLDEWLGLKVEQEWKNGDECVFDNKTKREFDNPLLEDKYQKQHATVHHTFKNKHEFDMVLIEFEGGYCAAVMQECISKPETPEQKAERERQHAVYDMCSDLDNHTDDARFWCEKLYDAGYRKQ